MKKTAKKRPADEFSTLLLKWNKEQNKREMPWKGEKDPYKIWLSEIILQQTRVDQGLAYYERFIAKFPSIKDLAAAPDTTVFKLWEGLGYYSRCRNLLVTARYVSNELNGVFPATYDEIKALKGIGPYTASAISSFAYNLPHAVVDGNVFRVLSRVFGVATPIDSTEGKKYFTQLADELLDTNKPGLYNQAIMDFGAIVCKPALPLCPTCVFNKDCFAYLEHKVNELPVKEKKISVKKRWFYYLVIEHKDKFAIRQRTGKDIWNQLYEFPVIETTAEQETADIIDIAEQQEWINADKYSLSFVSPLFKQQLSHQLIAGRFIALKAHKPGKLPEGSVWVSKKEMNEYPFPRFINQFLEKKDVIDHTLF
ncbi:MAG: A/G-specific adenine glycosylase [Chitinophagaceae bacterium]